MMKLNWTLLNVTVIGIISILYILFALPFFKEMVYLGDDLFTRYVFGSMTCQANIGFLDFLKCFRYADNGSFSVIFFYALWAYYFPTWLHIHPHDFWPLRAIFLIHFLLLAYSFSLWITFFLKPDEKKKYRIIAFLCGLGLVLFFFTSMKTSIFYDHLLFIGGDWTGAEGIDSYDNYLVNRFFRYFPTYIWLSFFLYFLAKFFLYKIKEASWLKKVFIIFLAFLLGLGGQYIVIVLSSFLGCLILYYLYPTLLERKVLKPPFIIRIVFHDNSATLQKSFLKHIPIYLYVALAVFVISAFLYITSPGFLLQNNRASFTLSILWHFIPTYISGLLMYLLGLFLSFKWEYVAFLLFFFFTSIFLKNKTYKLLLKRTLIFCLFIHISQIFIAFITFFMPFSYDGKIFESWLGHAPILSINYSPILIELCLFTSIAMKGLLLLIKQEDPSFGKLMNRFKKHTLSLLFFFLFLYTWRFLDFGGVMYYKNHSFAPGFIRYYILLKENKNHIHDLRLKYYQMDKLTRFFALHDSPIYWFKELEMETSISYNIILVDKEREGNHFMEKWSNVNYPVYLSSFYGKKTSEAMQKGFILESKEQVMKRFHDLGGVFTDEELKELRFTKLQDDNFVLGKK